MNYFDYLQKQIYIFALIILIYNVTYYLAIYFKWRSELLIPLENVIIGAIVFIFVGAYFNYLKDKKILL